MQVYTIKEHALNDDVLYMADDNKVFSGNYIAIIERYTFENEWSDAKEYKRFKTLQSLYKFLDKYYPEYQY